MTDPTTSENSAAAAASSDAAAVGTGERTGNDVPDGANVHRLRRLLIALVAFVVTVIAQTGAVLALKQGGADATGAGPFLIYLAWQCVAGFAEAVMFRECLPYEYRFPRKATLLLLWLACTLVPLLGGFIILFACGWARWFPGTVRSPQIVIVPRPTFVSNLVSQVTHGSGARLQARVSNVAVPAPDRLSALVAIQQMPTRTTSPLLRELLTDPLEDVRLIAYGRMDQAENEIMQKIFAARKQIAYAANDSQLQALHRLLAELYFELAYQNIVQGAVQTHALQQADQHAQEALAIRGGDAALWLRRGRLALVNSNPTLARESFEQARKLGFPADRLAPWMAEAAFLNGDYDAVHTLLEPLRSHAALPVFKPVVEYWST
ncbi:hypothetical protein [Robbsia sp. KACC 23696]|uniref:hypothetical protein n=1 Tax=Robbsia sp. KACC 23696 TaxID=3149231 RepID=UPI00325B1D14